MAHIHIYPSMLGQISYHLTNLISFPISATHSDCSFFIQTPHCSIFVYKNNRWKEQQISTYYNKIFDFCWQKVHKEPVLMAHRHQGIYLRAIVDDESITIHDSIQHIHQIKIFFHSFFCVFLSQIWCESKIAPSLSEQKEKKQEFLLLCRGDYWERQL